jgi:hypothetical protein
MNMSIKKRMALGAGAIATVAAVGTLVAGVTFGFFSATTGSNGNNTFTAGNVTLDTPVVSTCTVGPMVPGDSSTGYATTPGGQTDARTAACTVSVDYTGNVPAYIGLDLATSGTGLYDQTANGLQFQISDGTGSYATSGVLNGGSDLYVSTDPGTGSTNHTFTVNYALPTSADNSYQGKTTTLTLTVHAVQQGNNGNTTGCAAGAVCAGISTWS